MDKRRHTLTLKGPMPTDTSRGQLTGTRPTKGTYIAKVKPLSGREQEAANKLYGSAQYQVETYRDSQVDMTTKDVFEFVSPTGTKTLAIGYVETVDEVGRELKVLCSEVADG